MDPLADSIGDADWVRSPADLAIYLRRLHEHVQQEPDTFENLTSVDLIEAASAWVEASDHLWKLRGTDTSALNPWQVAAMVFAAGLIYE